MWLKLRDLLRSTRRYFNLLNDKEDEQEVVRQVSAGVVFRGTNLWILIFAIFIASLGLNVNSTAVIIGAMLISPLMGPIIGMGLSVGIGDYDLFRRAVKNYLVATLISVVTATVYFLLSPLNEARSELLARTSPTLYDVLIAFFGGAAGVLALITKSKGQVIPGVAIATALMPPLCTAGYGLASAQWSYFFGAFYLFFINTVFIAIATFLGVKLLGFHTVAGSEAPVLRRSRRLLTVVIVVILLPAAFMTWNIVRDDVQKREIARFVDHELSQSGTQILSATAQHDTLRVVAVGRVIADAELADARSRMGYYKMKVKDIAVIQASDAAVAAAASTELTTLHSQLAATRARLEGYTRFDTLAPQVGAEAAALFPEVREVRIGRVGSDLTAHVLLAPDADPGLDTLRLCDWLRTRLQDPDLWVELKSLTQ
jgi:uncharacterized hydrophobic protein (TIGR00271 family)